MTDNDERMDRWIEAQLKSPYAADIESPPRALAQSIAASLVRRRRRQYAACGIAAAAMLVVALSWAIQRNPHAIDMRETSVATEDNVAPAVFIGGDDVIAVPVASPYPNVTIVRVYPVYRLETLANADADRLPMTNDSTWSENINGG
jgi:hypothetical protein